MWYLCTVLSCCVYTARDNGKKRGIMDLTAAANAIGLAIRADNEAAACCGSTSLPQLSIAGPSNQSEAESAVVKRRKA